MVASIPLVNLKPGEQGTITGFQGGHGIHRNLEGLGIRIGSKIKLVSYHFRRGPVIISCGNTQLAIGYGMARRIMVNKD